MLQTELDSLDVGNPARDSAAEQGDSAAVAQTAVERLKSP
jgi:hypothetical protein